MDVMHLCVWFNLRQQNKDSSSRLSTWQSMNIFIGLSDDHARTVVSAGLAEPYLQVRGTRNV